MAKVKLSDLVGELSLANDEFSFYLDRQTAEVVHVSDDGLEAAEEGEMYEGEEDWEQEGFDLATLVFEKPDRFVELPDAFELNEWRTMERFASDQGAPYVRGELLDAIHGSGAFRRFKDCVYRLGIEKDWYEYRDDALRRVAIKWCETNGIEYDPA